MLTRTKLLIVTAALLASVSAVSASEPLESTINGSYAPVIGAKRNALAAYAQDRGPVRDFATGAGASFESDSVRDHAKGSVPN